MTSRLGNLGSIGGLRVGLTIGQLAERAGVHIETVRYYERRGLLPEPPRTPSNYRMYGEDAVERIKMIKRAQKLGFTLEEIKSILELADSGPKPGADCSLARRKAMELRREMAKIQAQLKMLAEVEDKCGWHAPGETCALVELLTTRGEMVEQL